MQHSFIHGLAFFVSHLASTPSFICIKLYATVARCTHHITKNVYKPLVCLFLQHIVDVYVFVHCATAVCALVTLCTYHCIVLEKFVGHNFNNYTEFPKTKNYIRVFVHCFGGAEQRWNNTTM